jgi:hypothetical protein
MTPTDFREHYEDSGPKFRHIYADVEARGPNNQANQRVS